MSFFAVLFALLLEQLKPLPRQNWFHDLLVQWVGWTSRNLDAGAPHHARIVWAVTVILPAAVAAALYVAVQTYSDVLALVFDVAVLYLTLGFRQFSHHFTGIRDALDQGDEGKARQLLAEWKLQGHGVETSDLPRSEILRHVIEHSVLSAHRHVLGVFLWFAVLAALGLGPAGAVLYRFAEWMPRLWRSSWLHEETSQEGDAPLITVGEQTWSWIDHVPARATSLGFAVVGNFEDAVDCWRNFAQKLAVEGRSDNDGIILAATSGAMGVRLGGPALAPGAAVDADANEAVATPGVEPQNAHLRSAVGLVWRSVVLWMVLLALLTLAKLLS